VRAATEAALVDHARRHFADREISVRFKAQFCYVNGTLEPVAPPPALDTIGDSGELRGSTGNEPMPLCRLRFFGPGRWSIAIYSYAHDRYDPSVFGDGEFFGLAVDGFELAATLYLG
jgi:hypothetical protein